jgi:hypothetical protein
MLDKEGNAAEDDTDLFVKADILSWSAIGSNELSRRDTVGILDTRWGCHNGYQ